MHQYNGFPLYASAIPTLQNGWHSQGIVFEPYEGGAITEIKRLEGPIY